MKPPLIVIGMTPPPHHGVAISTSLVLANRELARSFEVCHVDTSDRRDTANIGRLDWQNLLVAGRGLLGLLRRLRGRSGIVYLPLSQGLLAVLRDSLYIRLAAARGWKVVVHLRGGEFRDFFDRQGRLARWWIRGSLAEVASVGVMGERLRWMFEGLVASERIAIVPNGTPDIDLDGIVRENETGLYLGNLQRRKGVVEALEAAMIVLREHPGARFVFAGASELLDLEADLRGRARDSGDRIEFVGVVTGEAKREMLGRAGYLLFPPVEPEGHPRVVLEAQAAGLPVIATDRGAIAETVVDGETGFVVDDPVPEVLAEHVLRLLREPGLRERMGRAARDRHNSLFTQTVADRRFADWLRGVAAQDVPR